MDCVCGCGRNLAAGITDRNFIAANVALELLAWDKDRAGPHPGPDGREGLIARGADCYQRLLWSLHGEAGDDPDADCKAWLGESEALRATQPEMNKSKLFGTGPPDLGEADMSRLDRVHPEKSFTGSPGSVETAAFAAGATPAPTGGDLVDQLERLRSLRDDGALTGDEFAAAKARLLRD